MPHWSIEAKRESLRVLIAGLPCCDVPAEAESEGLGLEIVRRDALDEALLQLVRLRPHLAIIDPGSSRLGAMGALRAIQRLAPECRVVLAIDPFDDIRDEALRAGALACVPKPVDLERVCARLVRTARRLSRQAA